MSESSDFFRGRIDQTIDLRYPLGELGTRKPWQEFEAGLSHRFARRGRERQRVEGTELFGPATPPMSASLSETGSLDCGWDYWFRCCTSSTCSTGATRVWSIAGTRRRGGSRSRGWTTTSIATRAIRRRWRRSGSCWEIPASKTRSHND
jgi:hypothetical protein